MNIFLHISGGHSSSGDGRRDWFGRQRESLAGMEGRVKVRMRLDRVVFVLLASLQSHICNNPELQEIDREIPESAPKVL